MWIKEPETQLKESLHDYVNFLYKENNVFIMDNHLAAGWSWLNIVNPEDSHYFIHIDKHFDLLDFPTTIKKEILDKGINIKDLSFQEYLDLKQYGNNGTSWPMFRWDNYILNLKIAYPNLYKETYFATFQDGNKVDDFIDNEVEFLELITEIDYWIENKNDSGWIVNLDIDYFFNYINDKLVQILTDEVVRQLAINIKKVLNKIEVLTICLSPECCGGWDKSMHIMSIISEVLNLRFVEELNKKTTYNNV